MLTRKLSNILLFILGIIASNVAFSGELENAWYAKTFKVSIEEAVKIDQIVIEARKIADVFDKKEKTFSGMVIQHDPKFRIFFNVKRKKCKKNKHERGFRNRHWGHHKHCKNKLIKRLKRKIRHKTWKKYVKIKRVNYSIYDLQMISKKADMLASKFINNGYGLLINHKKNRVEVRTTNKKLFMYELFANGIRLPKGISVKEIFELPSLSAWGGATLDNSLGNPGCTSGFVVQDSRGRLGLSTASHCQVEGLSWNGSELELGGAIDSRDVAWYRLPLNIESQAQNRIKIGEAKFWEITGTAVVEQGDKVCAYGFKSAILTCGIVANVNASDYFKLTSTSAPVQRLGMINVTFNGEIDAGRIVVAGDSGGPLFNDHNAIGSVIGGDSKSSYFATVGSITAMGIKILTQ